MALRFGSKANANRLAISRREPEFLHVAWREPFRVSTHGPPSVWPKPFEQNREGKDLRTHLLLQSIELRVEFVRDLDHPAHTLIIAP